MPDIPPTILFPNMTANATGIVIPYTDLAGLTQAEANPTSGNGKAVGRSLAETIVRNVSSLNPDLAPLGMKTTKSITPSNGKNMIKETFTLSFTVVVDPDSVSVSPED